MRTAFLYIITICSLVSTSFAEVTPYDQACEEYWKEHKETTTVPEKWADETAVVLYRYSYNSYEKVSMSSEISHKHIYRQRIKLIDKSAISKYSEFKYDPIVYSSGVYKNIFGVKIIKPSGKEEVINLEEAVDIKDGDKVIKKKIAIPNLNKGDIIDFFFVTIEEVPTSAKFKLFSPVYYSLSDEMPILTQKIEFKVLRKCYINFKSINGAPTIKAIPSVSEDYDSYAIIDKDREKSKDNKWIFKYRQLPTIKFQIAYSKNDNKIDSRFFPGEPGVVKKTVSEQEILTLLNENLHPHEDARINEFFNKKPNDQLEGEELIAKINEFYKVRMGMNNCRKYDYSENLSSDFQAINYISTFLKSKNIAYDIVIAPRKHLSSIQDVIMVNDLLFFLKVNLKNKAYFIYPPSSFSNFGEINPEVEGVEAFVMKPSTIKGTSLKKITLPSISAEENISTVISRTSIDRDDNYKLSLFNVSTYNYVQKLYNQNIYPYSGNELSESTTLGYYSYGTYYTGSSSENMYKYPLVTQPSFTNITWRGIINDARQRYQDNLEDYDYNVTESGVSLLRPNLVIDSYCKLKNYVYKIGDDYLLDAGKLIGSQVKVAEDNLDRKKDIYSVSARSYYNTIYINIPEGYVVKGLDKLNKSIDNVCGTFTSSAELVNNQIVIKSKKVYKNSFEPVENWNELLKMLDMAWETSQVKILLKKAS